MANASASPLLELLGLEIKCRLFNMVDHTSWPKARVHRKCEQVPSMRNFCPHCHTGSVTEKDEPNPEHREPSEEDKAKLNAAKEAEEQARVVMLDSQGTTEHLARKYQEARQAREQLLSVLGSGGPALLKRLYCTSADCGKLIEDKAEQQSWCPHCKCVISDEDIALGWKIDGRFIELSKEQMEAIDGLALEKQMRVLEALRDFEHPPMRALKDQYQVLPGKGAELMLATFVESMKRNRLSFLVELKIKGRENVAWLVLDDDVLLCITMHPLREIKTQVVDPVQLDEDQVSQMGMVQMAAIRAGGHSRQFTTLETSRDEAFHGAVTAKMEGGDFTVQQPLRADEQTAAMTAQLAASMRERSRQLTQQASGA